MSSCWVWIVDLETLPDAAKASGRGDVQLLAALQSSSSFPQGITLPSRSQLQAWIKAGRVTQNGLVLRPGLPLQPSSRIEIELPPPTPSALVPENRPIEFLFEDEHLAIINKPAGLTVHPSGTQLEGTLVHALLHHLKDLSGIGGELRPGIVHRLDKDTSGALVVTKTDACHQRLAEVFSRHEIERVYEALCYGALPAPQGSLKTLLGRHPQDRKKMAVLEEGGRTAVTHYRTLSRYSVKEGRHFASRVELRLETGRTHQIRVHMTHLKASILGDPVYGTPSARAEKWTALPAEIQALVRSLPGQALHARVLGFVHPMTTQPIRVEAAAPESFSLLRQALEGYATGSAS